MKQKKLKFTIFSLAMHCIIIGVLLLNQVFDSGFWAILLGSFNMTIGVFAKFNHDDKKLYLRQGGE